MTPEYRASVLGNTTPEAAAETLEKAADLLESGELDWIRGELDRVTLVDDGRGVPYLKVFAACAVGTLRRTGMDANAVSAAHYCAEDTLARAAKEPYPLRPALSTWNDRIAKNKEEVIELFKETAKDLRNEGWGL